MKVDAKFLPWSIKNEAMGKVEGIDHDQHQKSKEDINGKMVTLKRERQKRYSDRENPEEEGVKLPHVAGDVGELRIELLQVADEGAKVLSYVHSALLVCQNVLQI